MKTWEQLKKDIKKIDPILEQDVEEIEIMSEIVSAIIDKRNELGLSQRDLANICGLPQSTIARCEALTVNPKMETLLKIMKPLGLTISVTQINV